MLFSSIFLKSGPKQSSLSDVCTNHIRVFHPVDTVPVSQVGVSGLIIVTGIWGLIRVGSGGSIDWDTKREQTRITCMVLFTHSSKCDGVKETLTINVNRQRFHHRARFTGLNIKHHLCVRERIYLKKKNKKIIWKKIVSYEQIHVTVTFLYLLFWCIYLMVSIRSSTRSWKQRKVEEWFTASFYRWKPSMRHLQHSHSFINMSCIRKWSNNSPTRWSCTITGKVVSAASCQCNSQINLMS